MIAQQIHTIPENQSIAFDMTQPAVANAHLPESKPDLSETANLQRDLNPTADTTTNTTTATKKRKMTLLVVLIKRLKLRRKEKEPKSKSKGKTIKKMTKMHRINQRMRMYLEKKMAMKKTIR